MAHTNESLTPVSDEQRVFGWYSHASLWFSLGVGLLVMQIGAYLVPAVGTQDALLAIVLGSVLGAGLLAWVAKIGCDSGLSSAGLMHQVFGSGFARLPVLLNIVQLIGWTTFELVVMRDGTLAMAPDSAWSSCAHHAAVGRRADLADDEFHAGSGEKFCQPIRFAAGGAVFDVAELAISGLAASARPASLWDKPGTGEMGFYRRWIW